MTMLAIRIAALAACLVPALAAAQTPPIKPGLWAVQADRLIDGKPMTPPGDAMKNLTPETRAKMDAMMKEKGISLGSGAAGGTRICLSRETLDAGHWQNAGANCKTDFVSRTASAWKWHSECAQTGSTTDGEAVFANGENYTVTTASTHGFRGETKTTRMTIHAKWVGADCGDLKPFDPKR
ncbi:MAG TPA: DUF3617 domain-containing protein [Caldimonas sp.]